MFAVFGDNIKSKTYYVIVIYRDTELTVANKYLIILWLACQRKKKIYSETYLHYSCIVF